MPTLGIRQASIALQRLSDLPLPLQRRLVRIGNVESCLTSFQAEPASLETAIREELNRILQVSDRFHSAELFSLFGHQRSHGLALVREWGEGREVVLPSGIYSFEPPVLSLGSRSRVLRLHLSGEVWFPGDDETFQLFHQGIQTFFIPPVTDRLPPDPDRYELEAAARVLASYAPPGSAFRRYLVDYLKALLAFPIQPLGVGSFRAAFERIFKSTKCRLESEQDRHHLYLHHAQVWIPQKLAMLRELYEEGVDFLNEKEWNRLRDMEERLPTAARDDLLASLDRLIETSPIASKVDQVKNAFETARAILRDFFVMHGDWKNLRIAVVGYGLDLDLIEFFLRFGFEVTGVEKRGAAEGWAKVGPRVTNDPRGVARAIGMPELGELQGGWTQFEPEEIRGVLHYPTNLRLFDAEDPDLPAETFDLVFAPALIDEAVATASKLPRKGGLLVVDAVEYQGIESAKDADAFRRHVPFPFKVLFEEKLPRGIWFLPGLYDGYRAAYILERF